MSKLDTSSQNPGENSALVQNLAESVMEPAMENELCTVHTPPQNPALNSALGKNLAEPAMESAVRRCGVSHTLVQNIRKEQEVEVATVATPPKIPAKTAINAQIRRSLSWSLPWNPSFKRCGVSNSTVSLIRKEVCDSHTPPQNPALNSALVQNLAESVMEPAMEPAVLQQTSINRKIKIGFVIGNEFCLNMADLPNSSKVYQRSPSGLAASFGHFGRFAVLTKTSLDVIGGEFERIRKIRRFRQNYVIISADNC